LPFRPLHVLITNVGLANRTGTEIVAMDLAAGLARAGHKPMIWAPRLDLAVAQPLTAAGIPVVSALADVPEIPDIIHGHHHLETVAALEHFPGVPGIFVCHSGFWWHDAPPRHSRLRHYVAVDEFCRERLLATPWIHNTEIEVISNAVDTRRYRRRAKLPAQPQRTLVFSNYAGEDTHLEPILEACRGLGLEVDTMGRGTGTASAEPERVLPDYDLVFAKARCALEAMASGCAVLLCDSSGLGPMVTSTNIDELRRWNFGFRTLSKPLRATLIAERIKQYDARDARIVTDYVHAKASLDNAVQQYVCLYRRVLDQRVGPADVESWHPQTRPLQVEDQANMRLSFVTTPQDAVQELHFTFEVALDNRSAKPVATAAPWPCFLMYRWLNLSSGAIVTEHGLRSIMQPPAWPGQRTEYTMRAIAPKQPGEYVLRVTIIQEGWRWLDKVDPALYADAQVTVTADLRMLATVGAA